MRRYETTARKKRDEFYESLKDAHKDGATPTELCNLVGVTYQRIGQIIYERRDSVEERL